MSDGVPFIITAEQKAELRARGFSVEQIAEMTPTEAHQRLGIVNGRELGAVSEIEVKQPEHGDAGATADQVVEPSPIEAEEIDPAEAENKARAEDAANKLAEARAKAKKMFDALDPRSAMDKTVDAYLDWRGLKGFDPAPACIRFDPKGEHWSRDKNGAPFKQYFPMLFVQATDPKTGEMTGGQRIYLADGGRGFAPVEKKHRKKTTNGCSISGSVGRLGEPVDGEPLIVGEGAETVLTAMQASGLPGWCVFGVTGLKKFDPPDNARWIIFCGENDDKQQNQNAFAEVIPRIIERGIKIGVAKPPPGVKDLNDLIRTRDDSTRLHQPRAGFGIVADIIERAKLESRSKDEVKDGVGTSKPDLPGLQDDDDDENKSDKFKFSMEEDGLYRGRSLISQPFEIRAQIRTVIDGKASGWGLLVRFKNPDGFPVEETVPSKALHADPSTLAGHLADAGMIIRASRAARGAFVEYLGSVSVPERMIVATRTGWIDAHGKRAFVLPNTVIGGDPGERVILSPEASAAAYAQAGTLDQWKANIAAPAKNHLLLRFSISTAMAGVLLELSGGEAASFTWSAYPARAKRPALRSEPAYGGKATRRRVLSKPGKRQAMLWRRALRARRIPV
jgi:hypothetical protein